MTRPAESWRSVVVLTLLGAGCAALISAVYSVAEPQIEINRETERLARYSALLDDVDRIDAEALVLPLSPDTDRTLRAVSVRGAYRSDRLAAFLVEAVVVGYSGPIRLVIAVDSEAGVIGVRVLEHAETPGIGDFIEARRSDWIDGFSGRSLSDPGETGWATSADGGVFDAVSGATVTARSVIRGVRASLERIGAETDLEQTLKDRAEP